MKILAYTFRLCVLMSIALIASCSGQSTPNKVTQGDVRFEIRPVVHPGTLHSTKEDAMASLGGNVPPNLEILKSKERQTNGNTVQGWYVVDKTALVTASDLRYARPKQATLFGSVYQVAFKLDPTATEKFREWTKANTGAYVAVVLDGVVVSAAVLRSEISSGEGWIEGDFTKQEAENLSAKLSRG
jgi:preprotein translocase subunit SecD